MAANQGLLNALVISNCQAAPISQILEFQTKDIKYTPFGVHLIPPKERLGRIERFVAENFHKFDIVIAAPLSNEFGLFSKDKIQDSFSKANVVKIHNFFFDGLHPDISYLGVLGARIRSPIGDYHSKIAIVSYLKGLSKRDTLDLFRDSFFNRIGYFSQFSKSLSEFRLRSSGLDADYTENLICLLKEAPCFFTSNHPTSYLFANYCYFLTDFLAKKLNVRKVESVIDWRYLPNPLSQSSIFPVFPEVADFNGLNYAGNYVFKGGAGCVTQHPLLLEEFIAAEFEIFSAVGRDKLLASSQVISALNQIESGL